MMELWPYAVGGSESDCITPPPFHGIISTTYNKNSAIAGY